MASETPHSSDEAPRALRSQRLGEGVSNASQCRGLRILVVDDVADAADSLALVLRILGHEVRTVYDGPAALAAAQDFHPHVILLDIGLPALDGYQVARRLRQTPILQSACLIAVSGHGQQSDLEQSHLAGFDQHLLKPVSSERLTAVLAEIAARLP
jgi:CheY-like chemotaxis protein